jgi:hypothetical protein
LEATVEELGDRLAVAHPLRAVGVELPDGILLAHVELGIARRVHLDGVFGHRVLLS